MAKPLVPSTTDVGVLLPFVADLLVERNSLLEKLRESETSQAYYSDRCTKLRANMRALREQHGDQIEKLQSQLERHHTTEELAEEQQRTASLQLELEKVRSLHNDAIAEKLRAQDLNKLALRATALHRGVVGDAKADFEKQSAVEVVAREALHASLGQMQREAEQTRLALTSTVEELRLAREELERAFGGRTVAECVVCWEKPVRVVLVPCGHVCVCASCSSGLDVCPMCMRNANTKLELFFP